MGLNPFSTSYLFHFKAIIAIKFHQAIMMCFFREFKDSLELMKYFGLEKIRTHDLDFGL